MLENVTIPYPEPTCKKKIERNNCIATFVNRPWCSLTDHFKAATLLCVFCTLAFFKYISYKNLYVLAETPEKTNPLMINDSRSNCNMGCPLRYLCSSNGICTYTRWQNKTIAVFNCACTHYPWAGQPGGTSGIAYVMHACTTRMVQSIYIIAKQLVRVVPHLFRITSASAATMFQWVHTPEWLESHKASEVAQNEIESRARCTFSRSVWSSCSMVTRIYGICTLAWACN